MDTTMKTPPIVTAQEWEAARERLLVKEKELTRARDALAAERRRMPWLPVEKDYAFDGPDGTKSLLGLFEGRRQLIIYRAFFEPGVIGRRPARSVAVAGPPAASAARMARRVGSASAVKTCSATASGSGGAAPASGGI